MKFENFDQIKNASLGELCEVQGISESVAQEILTTLNEEESS